MSKRRGEFVNDKGFPFRTSWVGEDGVPAGRFERRVSIFVPIYT